MQNKEQTAVRRSKPLREQLLMWLVCSVIVLTFLISYALLLRNVSHTVQDTQHLLSVQADTIANEVGNTLNSYRRLSEVLASNVQVQQFADYSGDENMDLLFPDYPGIVAPHRDGWYFVIVTCGSAADVEQIKAAIPTLMDSYEQAFSAALLCTDVTWGNSPENFALSVRAVSKELSGMNILEYIQRLRVAKAKELLETQRVKDVAQAVGFWDTQGLVRAFKKLEGITPSEYKDLLEGNAEAIKE